MRPILPLLAILLSFSMAFAGGREDVSDYEIGMQNSDSFLISCITFHYEYGPFPVGMDSNLANEMGVQRMSSNQLHFFWLLSRHGFSGIYNLYMPDCISALREKFPNLTNDEVRQRIDSTSILLNPAMRKLDNDLIAQCKAMISDSSVDSATRTACSYFVRERAN